MWTYGGGQGIRTLEYWVTALTVCKTVAFGRSASPPGTRKGHRAAVVHGAGSFCQPADVVGTAGMLIFLTLASALGERLEGPPDLVGPISYGIRA